MQRFAGSTAARNIVGQPHSTLDPASWLRDGKLVIINTAKSAVGEDAAALIGGTLINLVGLVVAEQGTLDPCQRRAVTLLVDEIHTIPGADYEGFLTELAKYGANIVLSTQSLERLRTIDREHGRAARRRLLQPRRPVRLPGERRRCSIGDGDVGTGNNGHWSA